MSLRKTCYRGRSTCNPGVLTGTVRLSRRERRGHGDTSRLMRRVPRSGTIHYRVLCFARFYWRYARISSGQSAVLSDNRTAFCHVCLTYARARVLQGRSPSSSSVTQRLFAHRDRRHASLNRFLSLWLSNYVIQLTVKNNLPICKNRLCRDVAFNFENFVGTSNFALFKNTLFLTICISKLFRVLCDKYHFVSTLIYKNISNSGNFWWQVFF